jgi:hypothetical protein
MNETHYSCQQLGPSIFCCQFRQLLCMTKCDFLSVYHSNALNLHIYEGERIRQRENKKENCSYV